MVLPTTHALTGLETLLADAVADRIRAADGSSPTLVTNTVTSVPVTFSPAYAVGVVPTVVVGVRGANPNTRLVSRDTAVSVTNTGFSVNVINTTGTGSVSFTYIAFA